VQEQATIKASFETSWQRANDHVDLFGEVDLGCSLPSLDDPDDPNYKPPSRAHNKNYPDDSNSEFKMPATIARCPVAGQSFDSIE